MKWWLLVPVLVAVGCGTDKDSENKQSGSTPLVGTLGTALKGYTLLDGAANSCSGSTCTASFTAGKTNCSLATMAFVNVKSDTAYVQKLDGVFIRQSEPHSIKFEAEPQSYDAPGRADGMQVYFYCHGQEG